MAIVLPLLILLLVMAVDFGRVFFGWVGLQNAARIGADRASQTAAAWPTANGPDEELAREQYVSQIEGDLRSVNCTPDSPIPDPIITDYDGDGDLYEFGDLVTVRLHCEFGLITPLAEGILGGPVALSATSTFAQHGIVVMGVPDAPPLPCQPPNISIESDPPALAAGGSRIDGVDPLPADPDAGLDVDFTAANVPSGCSSTTITWSFDGETASGPTATHSFNHSGSGFTNYPVTLTVTNELSTDTASITVRVRQ